MYDFDSALGQEVMSRFREWVASIAARDFDWLEANLSDDFRASTHPFPTFAVDKAAFIEADKNIEEIDVTFLDVQARQVGNIVVSQAIAKVGTEKIRDGLAEGLPTGPDIANLLSGKTVIYASAWRREKGRLFCFDHHLVGPAN